MTMEQSTSYRPEIDGLREVAVLAVIANHFSADAVSGGYLGVDVFFVISGFVITSSLFKRQEKSFRDFIVGFYERRCKRILPALIVYVLIMSTLVCLVEPLPGQYLRTGLASLFGISNMYLISQASDYFAESTQLNVFTHTWSLGVEEQFYLLYPLAFWVATQNRNIKASIKYLEIILVVGIVLSLIILGFSFSASQSVAYYSMPSRLWEIASGSLIWCIAYKRGSQISNRTSSVINGIIVDLFFAMLLVCLWFMPKASSLAHITVVVITGLIVLLSQNNSLSKGLLTSRLMTGVGLGSYSLYIWHWGVISFSLWTVGINSATLPFQIALIGILGWLSYSYIERPFRHTTAFGNLVIKTIPLSLSALCLASGYLLILGSPLKGRLFSGSLVSMQERFPSTYDGRRIRGNCGDEDASLEGQSEAVVCRFYQNNKANTIWLVGDSHAEAFLRVSSSIARDLDRELLGSALGGTLFPPTRYKLKDSNEYANNIAHMKELQELIVQHGRPNDLVIVGTRYQFHFGHDWYDFPTSMFEIHSDDGEVNYPISKEMNFREWSEQLLLFAKILEKRDINILLMTPTPEFPKAGNKNCRGVNQQWYNSLSKEECGPIPRKTFFGPNGKYTHIVSRLNILAKQASNIYLFDAFESLCPDEFCLHAEPGKPAFYRDDDHISNYANDKLVYPDLIEFIVNNQL